MSASCRVISAMSSTSRLSSIGTATIQIHMRHALTKANNKPLIKPLHARKLAKVAETEASCPSRATKPSRQGIKIRSTTYFVEQWHLGHLSSGCIVWLPAKDRILPGSTVDPKLHTMAFNHPAILLSIPAPLKHNSIVEIALMTTCGSRTLHQTSTLPHRSRLLRVKTAEHPYARVDLNLKNGKGVARKYSYVGLRKYRISLNTLGFCERQLGELVLTSQSLKKLVLRIEDAGRGCQGSFEVPRV